MSSSRLSQPVPLRSVSAPVFQVGAPTISPSYPLREDRSASAISWGSVLPSPSSCKRTSVHITCPWRQIRHGAHTWWKDCSMHHQAAVRIGSTKYLRKMISFSNWKEHSTIYLRHLTSLMRPATSSVWPVLVLKKSPTPAWHKSTPRLWALWPLNAGACSLAVARLDRLKNKEPSSTTLACYLCLKGGHHASNSCSITSLW